MSIKNLVLEVEANESAQSVQARLDKAGEDGFFLVNVVGHLLLLRASIVQKKAGTFEYLNNHRPNMDGKADAAKDFIRANAHVSNRALVGMLANLGIVRKKSWIGEVKQDIVGGDREEKDHKAEELLQAHPNLTNRALEQMCEKELGFKRSWMWFQRRRKAELNTV